MGKVTNNYDKYTRKLKKAIEKSLNTFHKSVEPQILEVTPKDSGRLRESFQFTKLESNNGFIEYAFHFGQGLVGTDGEPYASKVHEWYDNNINWTTEGTGPGFLLRPVDANKGDIKDIIKLNAKGIKI